MLVLGAGASLGGEAGLPLFKQIRSHIVDSLLPSDGLDPRDDLFESFVEKMAPESFFHTFVTAQVDVVGALVETFNANAPEPNAVHRACASLLAGGATAWTTNYDTLLEEACRDLGRPAAVWASPEPRSSRHDLAKPHGSLPPRSNGTWPAQPAPNLVFETSHLLADLPETWADAIVGDVAGRGIVLVGYSGADVDIAPHLARALDAAEWTAWFAMPREAALLERRYDLRSRSGPPGDPPLMLSPNPSESFLEWLGKNGLMSPVEPCPANRRPSLAGFDDISFPDLVRADVLANLGLARTSQALYERMARSRRTPIRDRVTASLRLARRNANRLRRKAPAAPLIRGVSRLPRWAPGVAVARNIAAEDSRTADEWPGTGVLQRWFDEAAPRTYRAVGLSLIRRLRYEGRLEEARNRAEQLLADARFVHPSPDHVAGLSFQLTEVYRMQGRMTAAVDLIQRGFSRILGTSLVLWEEFEDIACRIQRFDVSPAIGDDLALLGRSFARIGEPFGQETISLAHAIHRRQRGDHSSALVTLMMLGEATRNASPLLHDEAIFHTAETFRLLGDDDAALHYLGRMDRRWFLHDAFTKVALALIDPPGFDPVASLRDAHGEFVAKGCPWGEAVAVDVAAHLSVDIGLPSSEVARARACFVIEGTPSYSSDPAGWTFAMI